MRQRLVIIGGVAAGMSAAARARRTDPTMEIIVYEKSGYISYGACGFPYFIKGEVERIEDLIARTPAQMASQGICVCVHHEVVALDTARRVVSVRDLRGGREFDEPYDRLIIAAGARVPRPNIPGNALAGVFTLRTVEDALAIRDWLVTERPRHGVLLGASYTGLELAEALAANDVNVTLLDAADQVMPNLDADIAAHVQAGLEAQGVTVGLRQPVQSFVGPALVRDITCRVASRLEPRAQSVALGGNRPLRVREVVTATGTWPADIVIIGFGGRPNVEIARAAGIAIGATGAIAVDRKQCTSAPHVWAAGAAAEAHSLLTNAPTYHPGALTATQQGRVAGTNAAGGMARSGGVVGASIIKAFDMTITHTGLSETQAKALGFDAASVVIEGASKAGYMPGGAPIHTRLVYERDTGRLLGAQMVGTDGVGKRIDVVTAALRAGWTVEDLSQLDASYSPPYGGVWDPLLAAANAARP